MNGATASQGRALIPVDYFRTRSRRGARPAVSVRRHRFGSWLVLEVEGEMDIQAAALVADVDGSESAFVVFDLHGVTFMDAVPFGSVCFGCSVVLEAVSTPVGRGTPDTMRTGAQVTVDRASRRVGSGHHRRRATAPPLRGISSACAVLINAAGSSSVASGRR